MAPPLSRRPKRPLSYIRGHTPPLSSTLLPRGDSYTYMLDVLMIPLMRFFGLCSLGRREVTAAYFMLPWLEIHTFYRLKKGEHSSVKGININAASKSA